MADTPEIPTRPPGTPRKPDRTPTRASYRPSRPTRPPRKTIMSLRGTDDWLAWLTELSAHSRLMDRAKTIDVALADFARKVKFRPPPGR